MTAPASGPESFGPRRTAQGTIVGMPPVVREPVQLGQLCSTTMRSVYRADDGPCSDAFHPDRWSTPPATTLAPIVPCEEPEEDDSPQLLPKLDPTPESTAPAVEAIPEPPEPPTQRWQPKVAAAAEEPIILPFRDREAGPDIRLLLWAAVTSGVALLLLVAAVLAFA